MVLQGTRTLQAVVTEVEEAERDRAQVETQREGVISRISREKDAMMQASNEWRDARDKVSAGVVRMLGGHSCDG